MNWILTSVFLVIIVSVYYVFGSVILQFLKCENKKYTYKIITGFIGVTFIQWCIGFPSQLLHVSWNIYFWLLLSGYIISGVFVIRKYRILSKEETTIKLLQKIQKHIGNYWFVYVLTALFVFFSITSQLPYFEMNYDDHYYIGRIVQEIGSNQLALENYFTGSTVTLPFDRILTTYEIGYAFWADLFNITGPFFARFTMVALNYYLIFLALHTVCDIVIKKEKLVQFGLIGMIFLIIPAGYLWQKGYTLMYDGWQFNTAVWYGSSIVRMAGIPILLLLIPLFKTNKVKAIFAYAIVSITLLSFSAIAIPIVIMVTVAYLFAILTITIVKNPSKILKLASAGALITLVGIILFLFSINIDTIPFFNNVNEGMRTFITDNQYRLENSLIFTPTVILAVLSYFYVKKENRVVHITILISLTFFFIPPMLKLLHYGATGHFFVVARAFTGIQIVLIVLGSAFFVALVSGIVPKISKILVPAIAVLVLVAVNVFQFTHLDEYKGITFLGSGISESGYSVNRVLNNAYMVPKIYEDLRLYFEEQDSERLRIIAPAEISYENGTLKLSSGLIMSANNIEACSTIYAGCDGINLQDPDRRVIFGFLSGDVSQYTQLQDVMQRYDIKLILTEKEEVKNFLVNQGATIEVISTSLIGEKLYLLKTN